MMSTAMAEVFGLFAQEHRTIRLDVTSGLSRNLTERYRNGELDIVIVKESAASADCYASFLKKWHGLKVKMRLRLCLNQFV